MVTYLGTMNNSNGKVKASYNKSLNFTATGVLLIWILIIIFGIFSLINAFRLFNFPFILPLSYDNPFLYTVCITVVYIIVFFASRNVSISLINLFKNRQWIEPAKFIKGILIQLVTASIASILTIIFYQTINFTEFFSLFFSFAFLFSIIFLGFCLYYYRYDIPERQDFNNPNLLRRY